MSICRSCHCANCSNIFQKTGNRRTPRTRHELKFYLIIILELEFHHIVMTSTSRYSCISLISCIYSWRVWKGRRQAAMWTQRRRRVSHRVSVAVPVYPQQPEWVQDIPNSPVPTPSQITLRWVLCLIELLFWLQVLNYGIIVRWWTDFNR